MHYVCMCACVVHICDVPLQDILLAGGLVADKTSTEDNKQDKPADVAKDEDRTIAAAADDEDDVKVGKTSEKAKKTRTSIDKTVSDVDDKMKQNISDDKTRRRRQRSNELQRDDKISSSAAATAGPVTSEANSAITGKETVSGKEHKRRRSRRSVEVTNVPAAQTKHAVDGQLNFGSGTTHTAGDDVSYGSEAVEDVIQRLLDNDELDDTDRPVIMSAEATAARPTPSAARGSSSAAVDSLDTRRSREISRRSGKSPRTTGQMSAHTHTSGKSISAQMSVNLPASVGQMSGKSPVSAAQTSVNADTSGQPSDAASDTDDALAAEASGVSRGPRIKHVCRYASIALGKPLATFPPVTSSQLQLSALPSLEKERFLVEKDPGMY